MAISRSTFRDSTTIARIGALTITLVMVVYFATTDAVRSDNAFLVPDLALAGFLLVSALLPGRIAVPALLFSFGLSTGVYSVSLATYIVRGDFADGADHIALIVPSLVIVGFLLRKVADLFAAQR